MVFLPVLGAAFLEGTTAVSTMRTEEPSTTEAIFSGSTLAMVLAKSSAS